MLENWLNFVHQSKLARHFPVLLGLSLLPLHLSTFVLDGRLDLLLWSNHLLLASIWYLAVADTRRAAITLFLIYCAIVAVGFSWSIPVAKTAWLLMLAAALSGRLMAPPRESIYRFITVVYLLWLAGYQNFYLTQNAATAAPLLITLFLNVLGSLAVAVALIPLTASASQKKATLAGQLYTALALTSYIASAALIAITAASAGDSLLQSSVAITTLLVMIGGLAWATKQTGVEKYGYPEEFREWMTRTLEALSTVVDDREFIRDAMSRLATILEIQGIEWQVAGTKGAIGNTATPDLRTETAAGFILTTTGQAPSIALERQLQLALYILDVLAKFRQQEKQLKNQHHLESIYETGARITHDVKNLLQSLNTLTTAVEHSKPEQAAAIQALIRKQLPLIRQKLQTTLEKLEAPEDVSSTFQVARIWWEKLRLHSEHNRIEFHLQLDMDYLIPRDLFDRVAENLLENALRKRQSEPNITIRVDFRVTEQRISLHVTDTGSPAPPAIAETLFRGPIDSTSGYGIALYQCATQAIKEGFELALTHNQQGRVSFCLSGNIS